MLCTTGHLAEKFCGQIQNVGFVVQKNIEQKGGRCCITCSVISLANANSNLRSCTYAGVTVTRQQECICMIPDREILFASRYIIGKFVDVILLIREIFL